MAGFDSYIICTGPRSGSTLLCKLLSATRVAGNPDSYFHKPSIEKWLESLGLTSDESDSEVDVLRLIFDAARSQGSLATPVFGLRLQRPSLGFFVKQLDELHRGLMTDRQRIEAEFGTVCFIHLARLDKVEQAVSLLKAEQTGLWHVASDGSELERLSESRPLSYDTKAIHKRITMLTDHDQCWNDWFSKERIEPIRITYEDLSADPKGTLARVLKHLGIDQKFASLVAPEVAKMADRVSREWVKRFRSVRDPV